LHPFIRSISVSVFVWETATLLSGLITSLFGGISVGAVLLIAALGLAIVFGLMGVINMAHGELMMIGAYTTFLVQNAFKGTPLAEFYIFPALIAAFAISGLLGFLLERTVVRHLYGRPLETLLATWGVSLILQQFVRSVSWQFTIGLGIFGVLYYAGNLLIAKGRSTKFGWQQLVLTVGSGIAALVSCNILGDMFKLAITQPWFGAQNVDVTAPAWLLGGLPIGDDQLPSTRIFIIILTAICVTGVYWFLNKSMWGLRIRAVTQNREMSACLGIPTDRVDALTFALGSGLAGIAGVAVSLLGSVGPNTGTNYIIDTFMVVVVGGVGKLVGSIVAAMALGIASYLIGSDGFAPFLAWAPPIANFFTFFSNSSMAKVMVFSAIFVFLQARPAGLFPQKGRTVDN
jgi:urea transport system permease protein